MSARATGTGLLDRIIHWRPDRLIVLIVLAVVVAVLFPARGAVADTMGGVTTGAVALLFFLYGARLSPREAVQGLTHWRLHLLILAFTFVVFPLIGVVLHPLEGIIGRDLYLGILFLCLVPSTVQSSVAFTSVAHGNVAGAIVSASASNLLGVIVTPVLVLVLMSGDGLHIDASVFGTGALQLLLPFIIGQLTRRWVLRIAASPTTKWVDQISIALVVYSAFSEGIVEGVWSSVSWVTVVGLVVGSVVFVYVMLTLTSFTARKLGFGYGDQVAIQFCGTKKSLASGLPMAAVMFGSGGLGLLILPLMVFHQVQLMICSVRAAAYDRRAPDDTW
ncbi:bile acid:sodium symporter family protein [Corynebacterium bovis]|uniref:Bile acid:sodium symporter n=1 Tax=Corynebacterium bovis TaxID=36808 RepID=A0A426Q2P4_9CORY|nr:bile acid:sodium symporter family protein [Corynebacterium bovis]RRO91105.1 hypothetical protein CXF40_07300 [Corynebacterium bovis]RRO98024.1 hypothetical protein CXF32_02295 [Corynebacterium bovis]RRO98506.1 hypothetical protein CXF31_04375 [Corynebacterium bovis]RRO99270.1 hypothetical protein CXF41_10150 [Corynebacterium bovis]RRQ02270.1 hypothetical protein CXF42_10015 [Corynebacterium bovis]